MAITPSMLVFLMLVMGLSANTASSTSSTGLSCRMRELMRLVSSQNHERRLMRYSK
ncbi:hypothetical protein D9M72_623990 [compost metagenome]